MRASFTVASRFIYEDMTILDKSRVPVEKRNDPRLLEFEKALDLAMQDPAFRLHICLHEIGHAVYLERLGAEMVVCYPAIAFYNAETDAFDVGNLAVQANFGEKEKTFDSRAMARWYVAGGLVQHKLAVSPYNIGSDGQDFEVFTSQMEKFGGTPEIIREYWEEAKKDVLRDLRSPAFRRELWRRARELEKAMFTHTGEFRSTEPYVLPGVR
jgi:hypothetical protein